MKLDNLWDISDRVFKNIANEKDVIDLIRDYPSFDDEYAECLNRGGAHVFSGALRIFGLTDDIDAQNILKWNNPETWKKEYKSFFNDIWVFAEDIFGYQFLFNKNGIGRLDIETGEIEILCKTFTSWISIILDKPDYYSGSSVAAKWARTFPKERLTGRYHLCPITLFVCGGKYEIDNLFRIESIKNMKIKAQIAEQIKDLPDGTPIEFSFE